MVKSYILKRLLTFLNDIFKPLFAACMSDESSDKEETPKNCLTKREIDTLQLVHLVL